MPILRPGTCASSREIRPIPTIFLSYRRSDTSGYAGRLAASLGERFGASNVFQDIEAIAPGSDFPEALDAAVARCQVLVVLIGDTWLVERDRHGARRLEDPRDFVRLEIAAAFRRGIPVLPVLLEGASMPPAAELPEPLAPLARCQAIELSDTRWDYDLGRLVKAIAELTGTAPGRRRLWWWLAAGAVALAAVAAWLALAPHVPDLSGRWDLPDGSWWVVVQDGERIEVEEVHHGSRDVWLRGPGRIEGDHVEVELDTVYERDGGASGRLRIEQGGRVLRGELVMRPRGLRRPMLLVRPD